jgi:hypothetical protein
MISDKLADDGAAASFTGVLLTPSRVAERVMWVLDHPRPVLSVPRWRGAQVRFFDAFPRLSLRMARMILAAGRAGQRRQARRLGR